jgi:hypothetical protein
LKNFGPGLDFGKKLGGLIYFGVWGILDFGVLGFWGFGVLGFWGFGVLGFGVWGLGKTKKINANKKNSRKECISIIG